MTSMTSAKDDMIMRPFLFGINTKRHYYWMGVGRVHRRCVNKSKCRVSNVPPRSVLLGLCCKLRIPSHILSEATPPGSAAFVGTAHEYTLIC